MTVFVVGSGPAGISCSYGLLKQGINVTLLDGGIELERGRQKLLAELRKQPSDEWRDSTLSYLKGDLKTATKGILLKKAYGSDFPYQDISKFIPMHTKGIDVVPSLAKGGLSNVWGGAVLPYNDNDIADWPISVSDLEPNYKAVFRFMDLSGVEDNLSSFFPLYCKINSALKPSQQAVALMNDLERNADHLKANGFQFGYSRLAVRSFPTQNKSGCVYCGRCLYGCPYELIFNSAHTLAKLKENPSFCYLKDVVVQRISESNGRVNVQAISRKTNETLCFTGSRVYLAAGAISTTKILLESMEAYDQKLILRDSQYFLLPVLRYNALPQVNHEKLHTLSQIFIEILDRELSEYTIHLQVYTYNDLYQDFFKNKLGIIFPLFATPVRSLVSRLILIQGYLHSHLSTTATVHLERGKDGQPSQLYLVRHLNPATDKIIKGVSRKLFRYKKYFRFIPILKMLQIAQFGRGFHHGGSFPMRQNPSNYECDLLGIPYGFTKVHVVDSTVFPSIPATTITLTVMANAYRIARAHNEI